MMMYVISQHFKEKSKERLTYFKVSVLTKYAGKGDKKKIVLISVEVILWLQTFLFPSVIRVHNLLCKTPAARCVLELKTIPILIR